MTFAAGTTVLLGLYGTNHHTGLWGDPERFRPDHFADGSAEDPFTFVPQGGGGHHDGHRCAGEWMTIDLMKVAVRALTHWMDYTVPAQDLRISHRRVPTGTRSGFVITEWELAEPFAQARRGSSPTVNMPGIDPRADCSQGHRPRGRRRYQGWRRHRRVVHLHRLRRGAPDLGDLRGPRRAGPQAGDGRSPSLSERGWAADR